MKILHVELGRHLYGGARQVVYLLDGLARHSGEHALVCAEGAEIAKAISNPAVRVHALKSAGDLDLGFIDRLRQVIRAERPDLLHIHSRRGDMLAAMAGRLENVPLVHSRRVDNPPSVFDLHVKFPQFSKIITISDGIRQVLLQAGVPAGQVVCIPSAVDTERYQPLPGRAVFRAAFGLDADAPVLAMIAQLIPRKGHAVFFEALPQVLARHPTVKALIFGRGPLEQELRRTVSERGLDAQVAFKGFRTDMHAIIPHMDMVIHPAFMEGLGVALLEAAACGVPIAAGRAGGIPEIVRDGVNGRLLTPGDAAGLAEAINGMLDDPALLARYGQAGRQLVLEQFSIPRMVEQNWRVYAQLLGAADAA
ncbi:MAG: glycosyltransferase [Candidatus Methylumidiphilus sp.]